MRVAPLQMSTLEVTSTLGFYFSRFNLKSWYLFQAWKINARYDTMKCLCLSQSYITILSILFKPCRHRFPRPHLSKLLMHICSLALLVHMCHILTGFWTKQNQKNSVQLHEEDTLQFIHSFIGNVWRHSQILWQETQQWALSCFKICDYWVFHDRHICQIWPK